MKRNYLNHFVDRICNFVSSDATRLSVRFVLVLKLEIYLTSRYITRDLNSFDRILFHPIKWVFFLGVHIATARHYLL